MIRKTGSKGFTIVELAIVIALVALLVVLLRPVVKEMRAREEIYACADNLRRISVALRLYASEHKEMFPGSLKQLLDEGYLSSEKAFDCPGTVRAGTADDPDYIYVSGLNLMSPSGDVLVEDRRDNHRGLGKNVLYVSGDIDWNPEFD